MEKSIRAAVEARRGDLHDDLFRAIVENSPDLIAVIDAQARLTYASPVAFEFLGREPEACLQRDVLELVHPDDVIDLREHLTATLARTGEAPPWEFRILDVKGEWRHVEARAVNRLDDPAVRGVVVNIRDVSSQAHLNRALRTLGEGNQALIRSTDEQGLLQRMCRTVVDTGGYRLAWVGYAQDDPARTVRPMASAGEDGYVQGIRISWADDEYGQGPTGTAIRTGTVQVVHDLRESSSFIPWRQRALEHGLRTSLVLPLSKRGRTIGALNIYSDEVGAFDPPSVALLQDLADDLAYGIARLRDAVRLTHSLEATIGVLAVVSEMRDPYTAGHQARVGRLAAAIAVALGLPEDVVTGIRVAGELHDVGKISVPTELLTRPALLSTVEMELVKCHPRAGYDVVCGIEFPWPVADMVLQHHERLDGSGYPHGLAGDQILMGSKILAVADTVEAMSNHRPYRPGLGLEPALAEIAAGAGIRYDADAVRACVALFREGGFDYDEAGPSEWVLPSA